MSPDRRRKSRPDLGPPAVSCELEIIAVYKRPYDFSASVLLALEYTRMGRPFAVQ
jgi:hypothetical protein